MSKYKPAITETEHGFDYQIRTECDDMAVAIARELLDNLGFKNTTIRVAFRETEHGSIEDGLIIAFNHRDFFLFKLKDKNFSETLRRRTLDRLEEVMIESIAEGIKNEIDQEIIASLSAAATSKNK